MKNKIIPLLLLVLLITAVLSVGALASSYDPVRATISYSPKSVSGLEQINISITVTNVGDGDMTEPVVLYAPNGKPVSDFGENGSVKLSVGASKTYKGVWQLRQSDLDSGSVKYYIKYTMLNDKGEKVQQLKYLSAKFEYENVISDLQITRDVSPTVAKQNQEVTVTYTFINKGNVSATNIKVVENKSIATKSKTLDKVLPGEETTIVFTQKMGKKNLVSSSTVTYKSEKNNKKKTFDSQTITFGESKLSANLKASSKGVLVGETVKLTLDLENKGNIDFNNLNISDPTLGDVFTGQSLVAGQKLSLEKELIINEPSKFQFTISGTDSTNSEVSVKTDELEVKSINEDQKLTMIVSAEADKTTVFDDNGKVRFTISVNNNSLGEAKNVRIHHGDVDVYTFAEINPGQTKTITRDFTLSMPGEYKFTATCRNALDEQVSFESEGIYIDVSSPTMVPVVITPSPLPPLVTVAPKALIDAPDTYEQTGKISNIVTIIFASLSGLVLLLLAVAYALRFVSKAKSKKAVANIVNIAKNRDYHSENKDNDNIPVQAAPLSNDWQNTEYKRNIDTSEEDFVSPYADSVSEVKEDAEVLNNENNVEEEIVEGIERRTSYRRRSPGDN